MSETFYEELIGSFIIITLMMFTKKINPNRRQKLNTEVDLSSLKFVRWILFWFFYFLYILQSIQIRRLSQVCLHTLTTKR